MGGRHGCSAWLRTEGHSGTNPTTKCMGPDPCLLRNQLHERLCLGCFQWSWTCSYLALGCRVRAGLRSPHEPTWITHTHTHTRTPLFLLSVMSAALHLLSRGLLLVFWTLLQRKGAEQGQWRYVSLELRGQWTCLGGFGRGRDSVVERFRERGQEAGSSVEVSAEGCEEGRTAAGMRVIRSIFPA